MSASTPTNAYKILTESQWPLREDIFSTPLDKADGFVHLSTSIQAVMVANRYFSAESKLIILRLPLSKLESLDLRWEAPAPPDASRKDEETATGDLFPHIYPSADASKCLLTPDLIAEVMHVERSSDGTYKLDLPH
ncbi:hypothetical protein HDU67_002562 [Dinochytrium kinnereticum]|nr:hypothetical protein HDU67_002562 [Dinochytrium kinnereticum]